jgi:hypothetical protein
VFTFTTDALEEFKEFAVSGLRFRLQSKSWEECLQLSKELAKSLAQKLVEDGKYIASIILQGDSDALVCYTPNSPPESKCVFRKMAIRIFGHEVGWKIGRMFPVSVALFFLGFGIALGKLTHLLWEIGGLEEVFSPQGDYVGYALMLIGFLLAYQQIWESLKRKRGS